MTSYPSSIENYKQYQQTKRTLYDQHGVHYVRNTENLNKYTPVQRRQSSTEQGFEAVAGAATAVGAASSIFPVLAPVAAALGVGYGVYKLGHTFDLF